MGSIGAMTVEAHATDHPPIQVRIVSEDSATWSTTASDPGSGVTDDPTCPVCGEPISGVATRDPEEHFAQPVAIVFRQTIWNELM